MLLLFSSDAFSATRTTYDDGLRGLWTQINDGDHSLGIPPYNGGLFAPDRIAMFDRLRVPDDRLAPLLDALSRDSEGRKINYRDLSVSQLGSVYKRLLDAIGAVSISPAQTRGGGCDEDRRARF